MNERDECVGRLRSALQRVDDWACDSEDEKRLVEAAKMMLQHSEGDEALELLLRNVIRDREDVGGRLAQYLTTNA